MALVLDAGALIAFDRGDRRIAALVDAARRSHAPTVTSSGCVAQAWRTGGARQALLARLLTGVEEHGLDDHVSRPLGALCARSGSNDVVDAHVALLARDGDMVATNDPGDLQRLLGAIGTRATLERC